MHPNKKFILRQLTLVLLMGLVATSAAQAEEAAMPEYTLLDAIKAGKPMTNFRLRYETE